MARNLYTLPTVEEVTATLAQLLNALEENSPSHETGTCDGSYTADCEICRAVPRLPAFTGGYLAGFQGDAQLVNLRSFDDDHPCHEYQRAKSCPLWEGT